MDSLEYDHLTKEYLRVMTQRIAYWNKRFGTGVSMNPGSEDEREGYVEENFHQRKKDSRFISVEGNTL